MKSLFLSSPAFLRQEPGQPWLWGRHDLEFQERSASESDLLYHSLCARVSAFHCLSAASRQAESLTLQLRSRFLRSSLQGQVIGESLSAEKGERRSQIQALFPLPGGWDLILHHTARQELISGRVRLSTELWFKPGYALSFRWMILAKALKWALEKDLHSLSGGFHDGKHP